MSYHDEAIRWLKAGHATRIPEFETVYAAGKKRIMEAQKLFRLMSPAEAAAWNCIAPVTNGRISPASIHSLFVGGGGYTSKWFTFDRPYLFGRQAINQPGGREGQGMLMIVDLNHEMKNTLIKKLLPDVPLHGIPQPVKAGSCRCKLEGGVVTLGISIPVLERIAINMHIEHLGMRITP